MAVALEQEFIQLLTRRGMVVISGGGYPDLVVYDPERRGIVFAEIKDVGDEVRPNQEQVHKAMKQAGCDVRVWRRQDLDVFSREFDLSRSLAAQAHPGRAPATMLYELDRLKADIKFLAHRMEEMIGKALGVFEGFTQLRHEVLINSCDESPHGTLCRYDALIRELSERMASVSRESEAFHQELLDAKSRRAVGENLPQSLSEPAKQLRLVDFEEPES